MPSIGYGTNKKTRNTLPNGFRKFLINNVKVSKNTYTRVVGLQYDYKINNQLLCIVAGTRSADDV